ncbi:TetR/AcrR family transcriptional regulator [Methanomethylovorans sp.]|uniref:TetR/AcrR family transcriptional regulator n=1 Tax=Methanomethylovorans sp. TaxID=2758717 RepID=UPI002FDDB569
MDAEQRILNAALKVFASEGYIGATTRRIAKEANVAEVTLFRKFRSKENLLREVLIKNRAVFSALDPLFIIEKDVDLSASLHALGQSIARSMKEKELNGKYRMFMFMLLEEGKRRSEVAEILFSVYHMNVAHLSEYFEFQIKEGKMRNVDPRSAALTLISYFAHIYLLNGILGERLLYDMEAEFEGFIDIFANGILIKKEAELGE